MATKPKRKRLTNLKIGAIHFVDEGDNGPAEVAFFKRRHGAGAEEMPKTAEEILAGLSEDERKVLDAHMAALAAKPAGEANPDMELVEKAMGAMGDHPKADVIKAAMLKAMEDEAEDKEKGEPVEKDAAPSPDALPTDNAKGEANTGTAVDMAKRVDIEKKRADDLARENMELRRERRIEKAKGRAKEEFRGIPKMNADDMAQLLILSEDNLPEAVHSKLVDTLKATSVLISKSKMFVDDGLDMDSESTAKGRIEVAARAVQAEAKKDGKEVTFEKARTIAVERNPELYDEYRKELRGH